MRGLIGALCLLMMTESMAAADYSMSIHGTKCVTRDPYIRYGAQYGPYNAVSGGGVRPLWCSLDLMDVTTNSSEISVVVDVTDRNDGAGQDVTCSMWDMLWDGSGGLLISSGSTSGWNAGTDEILFLGFQLYYGQYVNMYCVLPPYQSSHGYSNLLSVWADVFQ